MAAVRSIWSCVIEQDVEAVEDLIRDGVRVDDRNQYGETALHLAARHGYTEMTQVLLKNGANVHIRDWESCWSPLHRSLYFGHIRVSLLLLQAGALLDDRLDEAAANCDSSNSGRKPRSESLDSYAKRRQAVRSAHGCQPTECLGDHDGNAPLDLLSLELRSRLTDARDKQQGGDVYSFGKADFFLGYDSLGAVDVVRPRRIEALANLQVVRVAASRYHSCAITRNGSLFTWGHGRGGRLGHGNEDVCMLPALVEGLSTQTVVEVAASDTHTAALTADGSLYTWGRDRFGQLGHGSGSSGRLVPKRVELLRKVRVVGTATGTEHTAAVTSAGEVYTWGRNNHGQLGFDGLSQTNVPRAVSFGGASRGGGGIKRHVLKVSASARSTVVITRGLDRGSGLTCVNEVYQWGQGTAQPSRVNFNNPNGGGSPSRWQTHDARVNVVQVAAAKNHSVALSSVGQVFTWGFGADNLGLDPRETRTARGPKLVPAMLPENCGGNAVHVSASDRHSCVVTDTGDLYTWGTAGEGVGALGHGDRSWQPVAKRVASLKKVALVAAAPDHTLVLLQASCPSLPHADSLALEDQVSDKHTGSVSWNSSGTLVVDDSSEDGEEGDSDVESVDVGDERSCLAEGEDAAAGTWFSSGLSEPLSLKQQCEVVLARQVDMRNVCSMLAFADTLDAPSLVKYCAEYVGNNLDGILVLGRPSDRECLLEASGPLACAALGKSAKRTRRASSVVEPAANADLIPDEEEGVVDREAMATALARAEMRATTPNVKSAAKAVRSLKKKIARISELASMQDLGKDLTPDQLVRVQQKDHMTAELSTLESRLERAKLSQAARTQRLGIDDKTPETERRLLYDETPTRGGDPSMSTGDANGAYSLEFSKQGQPLTPILDLSREKPRASKQHKICEACGVTCADLKMYGDHLQGKRHRAQMARLEKQLHDAAKGSHPQRPRTWANVSQPASSEAPLVPRASTECSLPVVTNETERSVGRGGAPCNPEAGRTPSQADRTPNRSTVDVHHTTMRMALEKQQRGATMAMASDAYSASPQQAPAVMSSLRSTPPASATRESSRGTQQPAVAAPVSFALTDFLTAPKTSKSSRKKAAGKESEEPKGSSWATGETTWREEVSDEVGKDQLSKQREFSDARRAMTSRKSFSEIIAEEERERKERDEYGDNAWFVSRKPRSTSFETIVQQQRHEEEAAEEEKTRAIQNAMDQEMLELVLEMSKHDVRPEESGTKSQGKKVRGGRKRSAFGSRRSGASTARERNGAATRAGCAESTGSTAAAKREVQEQARPATAAGGATTPSEHSRRRGGGHNRRRKAVC